jgi:hypothetical protein
MHDKFLLKIFFLNFFLKFKIYGLIIESAQNSKNMNIFNFFSNRINFLHKYSY